MKKIKYEKPTSLDVGRVAAVQGAGCSTGGSATDNCNPGSTAAGGGCLSGNNPTFIFFCDNGTVANGNCQPVGNLAGYTCNHGDNPTSTGYCGGGSIFYA